MKGILAMISLQNLHLRTKPLHIKLPIYEVFKRLYTHYDTVFFLESLGELGDFSRYSFLGFAPAHHLIARDNTLTIDGATSNVDNPFFALRSIMQQTHIPSETFCGGLVGNITYEGTKYFEPTINFPTHPDFPEFEFGLYLDAIIYDKKTKDFSYHYLAEDRSDELLAAVSSPVTLEPFSFRDLGANTTRQEYEAMIADSIEHIRAGDIFQIIMSVQFHYELTGSPLPIYERLRQVNPSPHMYFLKFGARQLIGASPELVVRFQADQTRKTGGLIENFPLAGTTRRGKTAEEDHALAEEMLADPKERAEHLMLVDLGRNDIGRVCEFGSVNVDKLMVVKKYGHVQHIASEITGTVRKDKDAFDCVAATSPMGTGSGAPKVEALKITNALEKYPRGPYSGEVGYFSFNGDCMFCIALRSLFVAGNHAYTQAGGGVVYDSNAANEYREAVRKGASMRTTLEDARILSRKQAQQEFSLDELRAELEKADENILHVLHAIDCERQAAAETNEERLLPPKQWVTQLFQSIGAGLTDVAVQEHFASIRENSPEVTRLLTGSHFNGKALDEEQCTLLQYYFSTKRHDLLEALQKRNYWVQHVAYVKQQQGLPIRHLDRERDLIAKSSAAGENFGITPTLVHLMYQYIVLPIAFEIQEVILQDI